MPNITKPLGLSTVWASAGTKIDPGTSKANIGWVVELPPYEYQNWVDNRQDQAIAHISQHGVPEWDSVTEYQGNLSYAQGSNGIIYKCISTNTNKDPSNPLNSTFWGQAFEVYGSVQTVSNALAAHIANYQTLSGISNVSAARANLSVYSKAESDTRFAGLNGSSAQVFAVAVATQPEHAVRLAQVSSLLTPATESASGVTQYATTGETEAGAIDTKSITPLKASTVFLKKSGNLAGLANVATARTNLGLGTIAVEAATSFLRASNNLSDLTNAATARANLGLASTATTPPATFLQTASNLADVPNKAAARSNLGLGDMSVLSSANVMFKYDNLTGITNAATARANLGLSDSGLYPSNTWLIRGNNLGDLTNAQTARNNLGLSNVVTMSAFGTVGVLDFTANIQGSVNYYRLPNNVIHQFGFATVNSNTRIGFLIPMNVGSVQLTIAHAQNPVDLRSRSVGVGDVDTAGFYASGSTPSGTAVLGVFWHAVGWA